MLEALEQPSVPLVEPTPAPTLDSLLRQFEDEVANPPDPVPSTSDDPALSAREIWQLYQEREAAGAAARQAEAEQNAATKAEVEAAHLRAHLDDLVKQAVTQYDLEGVPESAIEKMILGSQGDDLIDADAVAALQGMTENYRSHALRADIEHAALSVRNVSSDWRAVSPRYTPEQAMKLPDHVWEAYKKECIAEDADKHAAFMGRAR